MRTTRRSQRGRLSPFVPAVRAEWPNGVAYKGLSPSARPKRTPVCRKEMESAGKGAMNYTAFTKDAVLCRCQLPSSALIPQFGRLTRSTSSSWTTSIRTEETNLPRERNCFFNMSLKKAKSNEMSREASAGFPHVGPEISRREATPP